MRTTIPAVVMALGLAGLAGCSTGSAASDPVDGASRPLLVATTVSPITSIAAAIAGDRARIEGIVPEGTNSHTFEPAPQVAELLSTADLILVNGLKLEDPTIGLAEANKREATPIVEIGTTVLPEADYIYDFSFPKEDGKPNPHLWTDPTYAVKYAAVIRDELAKADPANADYYAQNYASFEARATELAEAVRSDQESVPAGNLKLLTYHDAYAYFAKNFGWTVIGAVQPSNFSDPTPADVARLIEQVRAEQVPTIFGSEVFPSAVLEEIGRATDARYEDSLRDDDLPGAPGDAEHSWLGLMRYNYETMIAGLGGDPSTLQGIDLSTSVPDTAVYPQ
ncbi:MAG: metal ABC transporter substrate-binding protein [Actinomycetota bacterium]|nr:metal ABC transporter substrate-binding protein [Actinomycetota bacterium]